VPEKQTFSYSSRQGNRTLTYTPPHICPICKAGIANLPSCSDVFLNENGFSSVFATITHCHACKSLFFTVYQQWNDGEYHEHASFPRSPEAPHKFPDFINATYPAFVKIYHQAEKAEQEGLTEICGVGYRKAVEYLVKDYLILKINNGTGSDEEKANEIERLKKTLLSQCISQIEDVRIKTSATKATWLGNDETHYTRVYQNRDLQDLKKFISAMVQCIELEHTINEIL
jgi:hypothetical protein